MLCFIYALKEVKIMEKQKTSGENRKKENKPVKKRIRRPVEEIILELEEKLEKARLKKAKKNMEYLAKIGIKLAVLMKEDIPSSQEDTDKIIKKMEDMFQC